MDRKLYVIFSGCIFVFYSIFCFSENVKMNFVIPDYKPYTYADENGTFKGVGFEMFEKIMKEINVEYTIKLVPNHKKALTVVAGGDADGFFLATQNKERDDISVFSEPLMTNRWCWFLLIDSKFDPKDKNFKTTARVGAISNTNTELWLKENGYNITASPPEEIMVPKMLKFGRADAFLAAELVFWDAVEGKEKRDFKQILQSEQPMGIYISKKFTEKHPDFMEKLNGAIRRVKEK